jgi:hypothetical protein
MGDGDGEGASAARKQLRNVGSAFFSNNLNRLRQHSLAVRICDDKELEAMSLNRMAHLNLIAGTSNT